MTTATGVMPLVCVICEEIVGVINVTAMAALLGSGEAYVCTACGELSADSDDDGVIVAHLEVCPPEYYSNLVTWIIAEADDGRA